MVAPLFYTTLYRDRSAKPNDFLEVLYPIYKKDIDVGPSFALYKSKFVTTKENEAFYGVAYYDINLGMFHFTPFSKAHTISRCIDIPGRSRFFAKRVEVPDVGDGVEVKHTFDRGNIHPDLGTSIGMRILYGRIFGG